MSAEKKSMAKKNRRIDNSRNTVTSHHNYHNNHNHNRVRATLGTSALSPSLKQPHTKTPVTALAKSNMKKVAAAITHKYNLCFYCLGRLFARQLHLSMYEPLGRRLWSSCKGSDTTTTTTSQCYICKGLYADIPQMLKMIYDATCEYEFDTFSVGAIIKPSIMDRDDRIRSAYRLRGSDSVKAGLTRELGRRFARMTSRRQDRHEPEMTITVQPAESYCEIRPKPVAVFGRYLKCVRGVPQKQDSCTSCLGRGCFECDMHGLSSYESVEGQISEFLFGVMGGTTARFTWIGGEDRDSLVSGCGRPFFARLQKPKKRRLKYDSIVNLKSVSVSSLRDVKLCDVGPLRFSSRAKILVAFDALNVDCPASADAHKCASMYNQKKSDSSDSVLSSADTSCNTMRDPAGIDSSRAMDISSHMLRKLRRLSGSMISIKSKNDTCTTKKITHMTYRRNDTGTFTVWADLEGGVPIKRFITGDGVSPSISEILGISCRCVQFDFEDVYVCDVSSP